MSQSQCLASTNEGIQCSRNTIPDSSCCWQHQEPVSELKDQAEDTELISLSYLPIDEALNVTQNNPKLQQKLVSTYFANQETLDLVVQMNRPDLVNALFDKNIGYIRLRAKSRGNGEKLFNMVLEVLRENTKLKNFGIDYLQIYSNNNFNNLIDALLGNKSVTSFTLAQSTPIIDYKMFAGLTRLIRNDSHLEGLVLAEVLGQEFTTRILELIYNRIRLKSLDISSNMINFQDNNLLARILSQNSLTYLNLSNNYLNGKYCIDFANVLAANTSLKTLNLHHVDIFPDKAIAIANALQNNSTLESLDLSANELGPDGFVAIANMLLVNRGLTSLDLNNSLPSDGDGIVRLLEAVKQNKTLKELSLDGEYEDEEGDISPVVDEFARTTKIKFEAPTNIYTLED